MPKKTTANQITIREHEAVVSFFTHSKKNHFDSEVKLYDSLVSAIMGINPNYSVHLTTHPYIAVHVAFGLVNGLNNDKARIEEAVQSVLERHLKQT
jgi:hypothetical protein